MLDIDDEPLEIRTETRGRKPLPGAPRVQHAVDLTDFEWQHLKDADPQGKGNASRGLRHLIALHRQAQATATSH